MADEIHSQFENGQFENGQFENGQFENGQFENGKTSALQNRSFLPRLLG
jgi:hypothetical protein